MREIFFGSERLASPANQLQENTGKRTRLRCKKGIVVISMRHNQSDNIVNFAGRCIRSLRLFKKSNNLRAKFPDLHADI